MHETPPEARRRGRSNRNRGAAAERELFKLLSEAVGLRIRRRLGQARDGGEDGEGLLGWAVECKNVRQMAVPTWWRQALRAAEAAKAKPVLFYRRPKVRGAPETDAWTAVLLDELVPDAHGFKGRLVAGPPAGREVSFAMAVALIKGLS